MPGRYPVPGSAESQADELGMGIRWVAERSPPYPHSGHSQVRSPSRRQHRREMGWGAGERPELDEGLSSRQRWAWVPGADKQLRQERVLLAGRRAGSQLREVTHCGKSTSPAGPVAPSPGLGRGRFSDRSRARGPHWAITGGPQKSAAN